jgi:hypothetical protein
MRRIALLGVGLVLMCAPAALWSVGCSKPEPPVDPSVLASREGMKLDAELRTLVGLTKDEVRLKRGEPEKTSEDVWRDVPMWGPGEGLGRLLRPGQPYDTWVWSDPKHTFYVWFADPKGVEPDRSKWKAVDVFVHTEGTVY